MFKLTIILLLGVHTHQTLSAALNEVPNETLAKWQRLSMPKADPELGAVLVENVPFDDTSKSASAGSNYCMCTMSKGTYTKAQDQRAIIQSDEAGTTTATTYATYTMSEPSTYQCSVIDSTNKMTQYKGQMNPAVDPQFTIQMQKNGDNWEGQTVPVLTVPELTYTCDQDTLHEMAETMIKALALTQYSKCSDTITNSFNVNAWVKSMQNGIFGDSDCAPAQP